LIEGAGSVLIGGSGRSGTNLVKNVLLGHERCCGLPFETRFVTDPDGTVPTLALLRCAWSPYTAASAFERHMALLERVGKRSGIDRLACKGKEMVGRFGRQVRLGRYAEWELERWFPGYWELGDRLRSDLKSCGFSGRWVGSSALYRRGGPRSISADDGRGDALGAFSQFLNSLYGGFLEKESAELYIDDNTFNVLYADWLHELLPRAIFVDVRRDPRDVVVSYMEQSWAPDEIADAAAYCKMVLRRSSRAIAAVPADQVVTLTLDEMADEPVVVSEKLSKMIGLESGAVDFSTDPVRRVSLGRWQRALPEADAEWLSSILEEEILEYQGISGHVKE